MVSLTTEQIMHARMPLVDIVVVAVCGLLCGFEGCVRREESQKERPVTRQNPVKIATYVQGAGAFVKLRSGR